MTDTAPAQPSISAKPTTLGGEVLLLATKVRMVRDVIQHRGSFVFDLSSIASRTKLNIYVPEKERVHATFDKKSIISVQIDFALRGHTEDESKLAAIDISATYSLKYDVAGVETIPDDVLQAFGEVNGRFNATSYWREFVHSCCTRAGLPPFPVRPYNGAQAINRLNAQELVPQPAQ